MPKKTFYIILIILAGLIIIGGVIWYFIFNSSTPTASPQGPGFIAPDREISKEWKPISENRVISAHFSDDDSILFYDFSGNLWQFKNGDSKPMLTDQIAIESPAETIWSISGKNIVKAGLNQSDVSHVFSDFNKKIFTNLRANIKSVIFSPDGGKIAYYLSSGNTNALHLSNPDGKSQKSLIGTLRLRDINLLWPKNNIISLTSKPSGLTTGSLWILNTANLNLTKLINGLFGLSALWSPDGNNFIYSYTDQNGQNPKLAIYKKGILKNINNISTLIDKCAWAKDSISIYCAIPESWPDSATLPDDYYKNAFLTTDDLWKINTETGEKNLILQGLGDVLSLDVNSNSDNLILISKNSRFLYQLNVQ